MQGIIKPDRFAHSFKITVGALWPRALCSVRRPRVIFTAFIFGLLGCLPFVLQAQVATGVFSTTDLDKLNAIAMGELAQSVAADQSAVVARSQANSTDTVNGRRELLLMERRLQSKAQSHKREANVFVYDYDTDEVVHIIVDLVSGEPISSDRLRNTQLPLTPTERERAASIVFSDPVNRAAVADAFNAVTGRWLEDVEEIQFKAFVFLASSVSLEKSRNTSDCGLRRCAKLLLYTADKTSLDLSPIVDLSESRVLEIDGDQISVPGE